MRIALVVTDLTPPRVGGISKVATEIARQYAILGHEIDVFCLPRSNTKPTGVRLIHVQPFLQVYKDYPVMSFSFAAFRKLLSLHREKAYDVSHAMNFNNFAYPFYKARFRREGLAHVSTGFETTEMELKAKWREFKSRPSVHCFAQIAMESFLAPWQRAYIGWAEAITTEDVETKENFVRKGISDQKISLVPSGVDLEEMNHGHNLNFQLEINGSPIFLCPGRIDSRKGTQFLIRAFSMVLKEMPQAYLILAGGGRGDYVTEIKKLITELDLNDNVTLTGKVEDMRPYYAKCDAVVIPSLSEGIPITLQEALAFKKPVVCSKLKGTHYYAKHLECIAWSEPGSVESLCDAIKQVVHLNEPSFLASAYQFICEYDWKAVAQKYLEVYQRAICASR